MLKIVKQQFGVRLLVLIATSIMGQLVSAQEATVQYLANEGVMVTHGETKILFDPLFRQSYGQYRLLPEEMVEALFDGSPPFDGVDAVFVSHSHGDHFSPQDMLRLLKAHDGIHLYAPKQAVDGLREIASGRDNTVFGRVSGVDLAYKDAPVTLETDTLLVEAVRIPHSGWPTGRLDVENIAWRVTLNESATVLHMGDADPNDVHFANDADYWDRNPPHMAFPPYWFFASTAGREILLNRIKAVRSVGVHVPDSVPADPIRRPEELKAYDLFTQPGETRTIE